MELRARRASEQVIEALADFRVVVINGPRQSAKSTLVGRLMLEGITADSVTLDDRESLRGARTDPRGFIEGRGRPFVIDEIQRGGEALVLAVKSAVDRDQRPGSFVLTGSSRFLTVPTLSESLSGRARIIDLWPFSQGELRGTRDQFLDRLVAGDEPGDMAWSPISRREAAVMVLAGGFPAVQSMSLDRSRRQWLSDYARTLVTRDLTDLSRIHRAADLPGLLETFVVAELMKQASWSDTPLRLAHYRDSEQPSHVPRRSPDGSALSMLWE